MIIKLKYKIPDAEGIFFITKDIGGGRSTQSYSRPDGKYYKIDNEEFEADPSIEIKSKTIISLLESYDENKIKLAINIIK